MLRQSSRLLVSRASAASIRCRRAFWTDLPAEIFGDSIFIDAWKKMIPNIDPPQTPLVYMVPRLPTPSTIPSQLTVNLGLPYNSLLSSKEVLKSDTEWYYWEGDYAFVELNVIFKGIDQSQSEVPQENEDVRVMAEEEEVPNIQPPSTYSSPSYCRMNISYQDQGTPLNYYAPNGYFEQNNPNQFTTQLPISPVFNPTTSPSVQEISENSFRSTLKPSAQKVKKKLFERRGP